MFRRLHRAVQDYFGFSVSEARGFLVLMGIVVLALLAPFALDLWPTHSFEPSQADRRQLDTLLAGLEIKAAETRPAQPYASRNAELREDEAPEVRTARLFTFNPNQISSEQWQQLGLPRWLADRILKYRAKGGQFRKKEDLLRIYDFPEETYQRLEPYIQLPNGKAVRLDDPPAVESGPAFETPALSPPNPKPAPKTIFTFDLNTADTSELKRVYGIGSKLSARIVKKREEFGGFHDLNQVREVWGLDSVVVEELFKHATLRSPQLRRLNVNTATFEQLRHPYLKFYVARAIIAYRQQHGPFGSPNDLLNVKVLDVKTLEKLTPYLEF
ncbi:MAG: helix-hairpin-helix domain-containing protein [Sphingobacteriaceae bacterium]|nr:helix-hairpin-helix domain-containing protein [Cytophagaceae bacterium]